MKQKIIILISLLFLLGAIGFMVNDFFFTNKTAQKNPYVYDISGFRKTDSASLCYKETGQMNPEASKLSGIAIGNDDQVFVTGDDKVFCYDKKGNLVNNFQIDGRVRCIAVSPAGELYLGAEDHIEIWNTTGKLTKKWEAFNQVTIITSIAVNEKYVFIADAGNKLVFRYDHHGNLNLTIGKKDVEKGIPGFIIPSPYFDLLLGRDGELWVVNPGRHEVEAFTEDGDLISSWGNTSMDADGFSGCCNPTHIAILTDGSFVTSEKGLERVKILMPSGGFNCMVAGPDQFLEGTTGIDLATDSNDRILVLDPGKGIVRIFDK